MKKKLGLMLIVILILGISIFYYVTAYSDKVKTVEGYRIGTEKYEEIISATGYVKYSQEVTVKSKVSGQIETLNYKRGDSVEKEALLLELDEQEAVNIYEQREAELKLAEARYGDYKTSYNKNIANYNKQLTLKKKELEESVLKREQLLQQINETKELYETGISTKSELEGLNDNLAVLEKQLEVKNVGIQSLSKPSYTEQEYIASIDNAKIRLKQQEEVMDHYDIRSPISGIVTEVLVEQGENVNVSESLVTISSLDNKYVTVEIDEKYIGDIRVGKEVMLVIEAYEDKQYKGEVFRVAPEINLEKGTIGLDIRIIEDPELFLKNMTVRVNIVTKSIEEGIVIDGDYIISGDEINVLTVDENNQVYKSEIKVFNLNVDKVLVTEGLVIDQIIIDPEEGEEGLEVRVSLEEGVE